MDETNAQKTPEPRNNAVSMKKKETNSVYYFLRFAYLADFLSIEALSTIYI